MTIVPTVYMLVQHLNQMSAATPSLTNTHQHMNILTQLSINQIKFLYIITKKGNKTNILE